MTVQNKTNLASTIATDLATNTTRAITEADVRGVFTNLLDSLYGQWNHTAITADTTLDTDNVFVTVDCTSGNVTITLPSAATLTAGRYFVIQRIDGSVNTVTIDADGAETINGAATKAIASQWDGIRVVCDGTNWTAFTLSGA